MKKILSLCLLLSMLLSLAFSVNASALDSNVSTDNNALSYDETILENKVFLDKEKSFIIAKGENISSSVITDYFATNGIEVTLTDKNGDSPETENLFTGLVVTSPEKAYTVILKGDTDGSGEIDSTDYLVLKGVFYKKSEYPKGIYFHASDVDDSGEIDSTDYLCIKNIFLGSSESESPDVPTNNLAGTYDVSLWVNIANGANESDEVFKKQIQAFMEENPEIVINATIEQVAISDASSKIIAGVVSAPDIYCFPQDSLSRLVRAGYLEAPSKEVQQLIKENNDSTAVDFATFNETIYAYPMINNNGYFMYYDKSLFSKEDIQSMEKMIAICEANDRKFRFALENAWYTASFFFATGCRSNWTMDDEGNFIAVDDNFNSAEGLIAMKGMQKLTQSIAYDSNADDFNDAGVVVTGLWNEETAKDHFGNNFAAAKLPSFEVDGKSYQLSSFSAGTLLGVKPQADNKKAAVLSLLAQYLTNEKCQLERYEELNWGPSNKAAQVSDIVKADESLSALYEQNQYSVKQDVIYGQWWDIAKRLGAEAKEAQSEADLKSALERYEEAINFWFSLTEEEKRAWNIVGNVCGTLWNTDIPMTEISENTWESDVLYLQAGEEFKVRRGYNWDINFGTGFNSAYNFVVEETGYYIVHFVWDGGEQGEITLIPAENN